MLKFLRLALALAALAAGLSGCSSVNERLSTGMGDYIPQWAGGLPADAPPRPGTPQYDAWMKERQRMRQTPAAERGSSGQGEQATGATTTSKDNVR